MPRGGGYYGRADINFRSFFQDFNMSKFVVYSSLLTFSMLFALKRDGILHWSWWSIFIPLFVWKGFAVSGAIVGSIVWWRRPQNHLNAEEYIQYKAMLISLATHLLLLMFELLVADQLQSDRHYWILVFVPLVFVSLISIPICIWSVRHDRSFELELFCAVNMLQFIFIALKLDSIINWPWEIIFVPTWIVLCISLVGVLYTIIFAGILLRMTEVNAEQRRTSTNSALGYSFLVIPLLVFLVLITNKLDAPKSDQWISYYFTACAPLFLTFFTLIMASFGSRGGNQYWFGLRKPPCQFLFGICPCLQLFGNISYSLYSNNNSNSNSGTASNGATGAGTPSSSSTSSSSNSQDLSEITLVYINSSSESSKKKAKNKLDHVVVPALALEMPD
jgi:hypothetical protein